jgi:hypothetical protein
LVLNCHWFDSFNFNFNFNYGREPTHTSRHREGRHRTARRGGERLPLLLLLQLLLLLLW